MTKILSSKEVKPVRQILEPPTVKAVDQVLQNKHESDERLIADHKDRASYIAPDGDTSIIADQSAAQRGRVLNVKEIVRRLKLANPAIVFEVAANFPDIGGLYIVENRPDPMTNVSPWKRHICGIPNGEVWEFHRPLVVDEEIPDVDGLGTVKSTKLEGMVPGWRQVLLRLVYDGAIQPADCEKYFQVSQGRSSEKWQQARIN